MEFDWRNIIKGIKKEDIPVAQTKARIFYKAVMSSLEDNDAIEIDTKEMDRNLIAVYYSIRNNMRKEGVLQRYKFNLDRDNSKVFIQKKLDRDM